MAFVHKRMARQLTDAEKGLVAKACEAMETLGTPDDLSDQTYIPQKPEFGEMINLTQQELLFTDINPMLYHGPLNERGHPTRVMIMGTCISRILGFDQDARIAECVLGAAHDGGKLKGKDNEGNKYYPEDNPHPINSKRYIEYLEIFKKGHVAFENIPKYWGEMIASSIEQSHTHQNGKYLNEPYPVKLILPSTPESFFLSQTLAITDFLDAITSRPCKFTGKYHSSDEVIAMALKEYGDMRLTYKGDLFPKTDINGRELIYELHRVGFAGREKPTNMLEEYFRMNPFEGIEIK